MKVEQIAKALREWGCGNYAPDVPTHMRHCREAADLLEASLTKQADRDAVARIVFAPDKHALTCWDDAQTFAERHPHSATARCVRDAFTKADAILAALSASRPESVDETGWLIEHGGHSIPTYWTGESWGRWSSDHKRACRFARREDAFKVSLALGDTPHDPPHKIIEHMWMKP